MKYKYIICIFMVGIIVFTTNLYGNKVQSATVKSTKLKTTIILYNTHTNEKYSYGESVMNITNNLKDKILKKGLDCSYLNIPLNTPRNKAFEISRNKIEQNVDHYSNKILLDIHSDNFEANNNFYDGIRIIVAKRNMSFNQNLTFANLLLAQLKKNGNANVSININENVTQNQDLSTKALLIEVGNLNSSEKDIQNYTDMLSDALKNICSD